MKKIILALFTILLMVSCQKDDEQLLNVEELEATEISKKRAIAPGIGILKTCIYVPVTITILAGNYSGCELLQKMNEKREEFSRVIDQETGCPKYSIPAINYINCVFMDEPFYIEQWSMLSKYVCDGINPCTDSHGNPMEPGDHENIELSGD